MKVSHVCWSVFSGDDVSDTACRPVGSHRGETFREMAAESRVMELSRSVITDEAEAYRESEPLVTVEDQHLDILPGMFADGEFGRRDAEWVVRWYFRRFLGAYPDAERRRREEAFRTNDFGTVRDVLVDLRSLDAADALDRLTALDGVDVPVATAFLQFSAPDAYIVVGAREWSVLHEAGELADPYPDPPSPADYHSYLETCRRLADAFDCALPTLYRALWRLGRPED